MSKHYNNEETTPEEINLEDAVAPETMAEEAEAEADECVDEELHRIEALQQQLADAKAAVEKETIKVVAHSMGPAYAKGFISGLQSYAQDAGLKHKIEMEIDLAPFQPHLQKANSDVPTTTISHWRDGIAGPSFMWGAKNYRTGFWKISLLPTTEHSISSFNEEIQKFIPRGNPERGGSEGIWEENGDN